MNNIKEINTTKIRPTIRPVFDELLFELLFELLLFLSIKEGAYWRLFFKRSPQDIIINFNP